MLMESPWKNKPSLPPSSTAPSFDFCFSQQGAWHIMSYCWRSHCSLLVPMPLQGGSTFCQEVESISPLLTGPPMPQDSSHSLQFILPVASDFFHVQVWLYPCLKFLSSFPLLWKAVHMSWCHSCVPDGAGPAYVLSPTSLNRLPWGSCLCWNITSSPSFQLFSA